jgi:predicted RNA-binding Zn-ribbon protein involved in translation (DUF1610 family)
MPTLVEELNLERMDVHDKCPKCGTICTYDEMRDPIKPPIKYNEDKSPTKLNFYCDECGDMFKIDYLIKIKFERYKNELL